MRRIDRRGFLCGVAAVGALGACARGSVEIADRPRPPAEGGIGGTGIVGVVTALGSVVIGGRRVEITPETAITDAFGPLTEADLGPGHSLTVEAAPAQGGSGDGGALVARRIHLTHPVIGPVESRAADGRSLTVAGVRVHLEPGVPDAPAPGASVAVSGLWQGANVVASRLDARAPGGPQVIAGEVGGIARELAIGARVIDAARINRPEPGSFATIFGGGRPGGPLIAERLVPGRFTGASGPLAGLLIEGYLTPIPARPHFAVSGLGHSFDADAEVAALFGQRAIFHGAYTGAFEVAVAAPVPEGLGDRADVLAPGTEVAELPGAISTRPR